MKNNTQRNSPERKPLRQEQRQRAFHAPSSRPSLPKDLLAISVVVLIASVFCFYNLGAYSIRDWDEGTHILAVQNMFRNGHWLTPMVEAEAYFNKPPLKMWLSAISQYLLGESNFSWRFLDALAGVGTGIVVYCFGVQLFGNRLAALLGAIALFTSRGYLFEHTVRMAVQDSALVFFTTLSIWAGWHGLALGSQSHNKEYRLRPKRTWIVLCGVSIAAAVLTKNLPGFLGLCVLGACGLLTGVLFTRQGIFATLVIIALATLLPALYFIPHCLFSDGACATFFGFEVWDRVTEGYHNEDNPWLYWQLIAKREYALHPILLGAGFALCLWRIATRFETRSLLLLLWTIPPFIALSLSASRLPWYIAPLYPAVALMTTAVFAALFTGFQRYYDQLSQGTLRNQATTATTIRLLSLAMLGLGLLTVLSIEASESLDRVSREKDRIAFDVLHHWQQQQPQTNILHYALPAVARREQAYLRGMLPRSKPPIDLATLEKQNNPFILLTQRVTLNEVFATALPTSYYLLPAFAERKTELVALGYGSEEMLPPFFNSHRELIDFGKKDAPLAFGWSHAGSFGNLGIRNTTAEESGVLLKGDWLSASRPAALFLNIALRRVDGATAESNRIAVYLNQRHIGTLAPKNQSLQTHQIDIPKGFLQDGKNLLTITSDPSATIMANWLSVQLR